MKPVAFAIASLLASCAADATTTLPPATQPTSEPVAATSGTTEPPAQTETTPETLVDDATPEPEVETGPIPRRCNALAHMRCDGRACEASDAWTTRALRRERGRVSYYADAFQGRRTANGDRYDRDALTAASRELPFGTILRIRRVDRRGGVVIVRVNDRGPFGRRTRILDLSRAAANCIDMIRAGVVEVDSEVIRWGTRSSSRRH